MKDKHIVAGLLFLCCAAIVALLAYKGFNSSKKTLTPHQASSKFNADFADIISQATQKLTDIEKAFVNEQGQRAKNTDTVVAFDACRTLVKFWDSVERFDVAGYYYTQMYDRNPTEFNLMNASQRYYEHATVVADSSASAFFLKRAADGFKKALKQNPSNLDAKVGVAMCTVTDRNMVMQAIPMLKEVLAADSNHIRANFVLGVLQIESGQLPKALHSFEKLVSLQPLNGEFYFYLAEVQQKMGNTQAAIFNYEQAKVHSTNAASREGIEQIIKELKK